MGCARSRLHHDGSRVTAYGVPASCQSMARGVPCGKEEVDFYRFNVKLKVLISYDFVHVASAWQENPAPTRRFLSGCHQID